MNVFDDFKKYRDQYGFNGLNTDGTMGETTQNAALFTMEYLICLWNDSNTPLEVKLAETQRLVEVYKQLEIYPGISIRKPGSTEYDSMDNTGALATFSALYDNGGYAKRSYEHGSKKRMETWDPGQAGERNKKYWWIARLVSGGLKPRWTWNNNNPNLWCFTGWHGRSPGHRAHLKLCAGKLIGPVGAIAILVGQFLGCLKPVGDTDARKLPYCDWQLLKDRNFIWALFYKLWIKILLKQYPNGMRDVYAIYYRDPNHPIHKYSKPY
jgi:hypothetical protein